MPLSNDEEIEAEGSRVSECLSSVYLPLVFSWSTSSFLLRQLFLRPGGHEGSEGGRRGKGDEGMEETGGSAGAVQMHWPSLFLGSKG